MFLEVFWTLKSIELTSIYHIRSIQPIKGPIQENEHERGEILNENLNLFFSVL